MPSSNDYPPWVESFDALKLSGKAPSPPRVGPPRPPPAPTRPPASPGGSNFVGGFNPLNARAYGYPPGGRPGPSMPLPIPSYTGRAESSLTMQHALSAPHDVPTFSRTHPPTPPRLAPPTPPTRPHSGPASAHPSSSRTNHDDQEPAPSPPRRPARRRATSVPVSPSTSSSGDGLTQCSGVTKAGKRCTRQVKVGTALSDIDPDAQIERFCHQHTKEILGPSGFYSRKTGRDWIKFEDWIPDYVQLDTQAALRSEMERARSQSDVPGYIYTFEIRGSLSLAS